MRLSKCCRSDKPAEFGTAASKPGRFLIVFLRARSSSADETWAVHTVFRKESDAALITGQARVRCHSLAQPPGRRPRTPRSASLAVHLSENNTGWHFTSFSMRARWRYFYLWKIVRSSRKQLRVQKASDGQSAPTKVTSTLFDSLGFSFPRIEWKMVRCCVWPCLYYMLCCSQGFLFNEQL